MKIALVYNPKLAAKRLGRVNALAEVLERAGHSLTHFAAESFEAVRDAADMDSVVIAGGDGTARLVIANQSDLAALPPVAVYPIGTINLLARELRYPRDPAKFVARIMNEEAHTISRLATINGKPFLACASVGFDAQTVAVVSEDVKLRIGRFAYVTAMLSLVTDWPRRQFTLDCDGRRFEAEALFVLRGRFYAGPWSLDPQAALHHEKLRALALPRAGRRDVARLLTYAVTGSRMPHGKWNFIEADAIKVVCADDQAVQADGDILLRGPATFDLTDDAVTFL